MKQLGKFVIMTEREFNSFAWLNDDIQNEVKWWHEQSDKIDTERANRRAERKRAFNAGKWHAAGGYGKALKATRGKLQETETLLSATASQRFDMQRLLEKWLPLVEALETTKGQFTETT